MDQVFFADWCALIIEVTMYSALCKLRIFHKINIRNCDHFPFFSCKRAHLVLHLGRIKDWKVCFQQFCCCIVFEDNRIFSRSNRFCMQALCAKLCYFLCQCFGINCIEALCTASAPSDLGVAIFAGNYAQRNRNGMSTVGQSSSVIVHQNNFLIILMTGTIADRVNLAFFAQNLFCFYQSFCCFPFIQRSKLLCIGQFFLKCRDWVVIFFGCHCRNLHLLYNIFCTIQLIKEGAASFSILTSFHKINTFTGTNRFFLLAIQNIQSKLSGLCNIKTNVCKTFLFELFCQFSECCFLRCHHA